MKPKRTPNHHMLVTEVEENGQKKVIGAISLNISPNPRMKHSGSIGIMVHKDYQGKGVGRALFSKIIDLADNWFPPLHFHLSLL